MLAFYVPAAVAVVSTAMAVSRLNAVHGLLYFIVSLLSVALVFFVLGAPFVAALEVIIYAGAIMVLFVFVVMLLRLGPESALEERRLLKPGMWYGPGCLVLLLAWELVFLWWRGRFPALPAQVVEPKEVGMLLLGPYALGVEMAGMLLLAGLVGAYHLARREGRGER